MDKYTIVPKEEEELSFFDLTWKKMNLHQKWLLNGWDIAVIDPMKTICKSYYHARDSEIETLQRIVRSYHKKFGDLDEKDILE